MRISNLFILLPLAACGHGQQAARDEEQRQLATAPHFPCAQGGGALRPDCTAERAQTDTGWIITIRHPDGHFRRLAVSQDGQQVAAADGALRASVTPDARGVNVAIGGDHYRLPAANPR